MDDGLAGAPESRAYAAIEYAQLDDFFHRFGLRVPPRARASFKDEQAEWCARGGAAGMKIMNLVDIERRFLRDEDEEDEEDEDGDGFHDDDDDDDA